MTQKEISLADWMTRIRQYENSIYVRVQVAGEWGNVALVDLSPERWGEEVARMLEAGIYPTRVLDENEIERGE